MRILHGALALAILLGGCQTASYKETKQLAGTSWRANGPGTNHKAFAELLFGTKLAPSGMGQVQVADKDIWLFQVVDGKLVMKHSALEGHNRVFDFHVDGDTLTIAELDESGNATGSQTFTKE